MARAGEDAVPAFGVPAGDAVLEFGRAVEMDFLGALDGPVFEDVVAARGGVALDGRRVGTAALEGVGDDAGVGAEGVQVAEVFGIAEFAGEAGGEDEADAGDAGKHGVGGGGEGEGGVGAQFAGVALEALVEIDGGGEGALEGGDAMGGGRQRFAGQGDDLRGGFVGMVDAVAAQRLARLAALRRAISGALKRSFISSREASQKGVRPLLESLRKPGKSWSTRAWMRLEAAVCWRTRVRRQRVSSRRWW